MNIHKLPFHPPIFRRSNEKVPLAMAESLNPSNRTAKLSARRKERVLIPEGSGRDLPISKFFNHPKGIEAILNTRTLQSFQLLDSNTYRCELQRIEFFNFEVSPIIDLQVIPTSEDCTIEMISCRFEGSKAVEKQNELFSAFMRNHIKWEEGGSNTFLVVDAHLEIALQVYTQPFTMLPLSTVEKPGNLLMQGLLDRLVPSLVEQLLGDYRSWVEEQIEVSI